MKNPKVQYGKTQEEEMRLAFLQKRQPYCVNGYHPLDIIQQMQHELITWTFDKRLGYVKQSDGSADKPYHVGCGYADHALIDEKLVSF